MDSTNPATNRPLESYEEHSTSEVDTMLGDAAAAFETWNHRPFADRERLLVAAADVFRANARGYAETMTRETGKPITQAEAEVEKCAWARDHYAEHAGLDPDHHPSPPGTSVKVVYEPGGPVLAVVSWNFPFWRAFRFAAPYLTAGNVGPLKRASNVPGCALALEEVFREAGYPDGVFQTLLIPSDRVEAVPADDRVEAATLTGSDRAGRAIASTAGEHLKKTVPELGGSDPYVVSEDADLDAAASTGVWARNQNGGQSCLAAKRFVVVEAVYDAFLDRFVVAVESLVVGDPMDPDTEVGPRARQDLLEDLHEQVRAGVDAGATLVTGGEPLDRDGAYYPPTVLTDAPDGSPVDTEELFGPVVALYRVEDEAAAVEEANDTAFGLGASVWTADRERGAIDAGCVYVNELVKSDPRVPFGGVGTSGYGRELSEGGITGFVSRRTVWLADDPDDGTVVE